MVGERIALSGQASVPVPRTTEEAEFDLFVLGLLQLRLRQARRPVENPFQSPQQATAKASPACRKSDWSEREPVCCASAQAAASVPTAVREVLLGRKPSQGEEFQSIMLEMLRQQNQSTMELLRQQSLACSRTSRWLRQCFAAWI